MTSTTNITVPTLLLERDGYEIETVLVGSFAKYTAWLLLTRRASGRVSAAASGWATNHDEARREAYAAFEQHSRMAAAQEAAARLRTQRGQ